MSAAAAVSAVAQCNHLNYEAPSAEDYTGPLENPKQTTLLAVVAAAAYAAAAPLASVAAAGEEVAAAARENRNASHLGPDPDTDPDPAHDCSVFPIFEKLQ